MSAVTDPPVGHPPSPRDRSVPLLVSAAALLVVVVGLVVTFGVDRPPPLRDLADEPVPAPPGEVAWVSWDGEAGGCVDVASVDGTRRRLRCEPDLGEVVGWSAEGLLVRGWTGGAERLSVLDPRDGSLVDVRPSSDPHDVAWQDDALSWQRDAGALVVRDARTDAVLWRVDAPSRYRLETSVASPDGTAVAAIDSAGRLLLFDLQGGEPRVWVDDIGGWATLHWSPPTPP